MEDQKKFAKIHLGCGQKYIKGWFHVDALEFDHIDHVGQVDHLPFIPDNSAELIYACHVLEHFGRDTYKAALTEWFRILAPGGVLRLAVPDFRIAAELYLSGTLPRGIEDVRGLVTGGQRERFDYHNMIFDEPSLCEDLKGIGFRAVTRWDWRQTEHSHIDDYSQAYLPHMDKVNGTLVSLNLEANK